MRLTVLGSSGSYPAPGRPASGYVWQEGGTTLVTDLGPGTMSVLSDMFDVADVDGVVISHQHPDHCSDLFALYHTLAFGPEPRRRVPLWAPQAVLDAFFAFLGQSGSGGRFASTFEVTAVDSGDDVAVGDLQLLFAAMDHSVPTLGVRVSGAHRAAFYTADTGAEGDWPETAEGVDLMVSEATEGAATGAGAYRHHLSAEEAGRIARAAGAKRLMLTHIPPHEDMTAAVEDAERAFDRPVALAVARTPSEV